MAWRRHRPHAVPRWLVCSESSYLLGLGGMWAHLLDDELREDTEYSVPFESQPLLFVAVTSYKSGRLTRYSPERRRVRVEVGEALLVREAREGLVQSFVGVRGTSTDDLGRGRREDLAGELGDALDGDLGVVRVLRGAARRRAREAEAPAAQARLRRLLGAVPLQGAEEGLDAARATGASVTRRWREGTRGFRCSPRAASRPAGAGPRGNQGPGT